MQERHRGAETHVCRPPGKSDGTGFLPSGHTDEALLDDPAGWRMHGVITWPVSQRNRLVAKLNWMV